MSSGPPVVHLYPQELQERLDEAENRLGQMQAALEELGSEHENLVAERDALAQDVWIVRKDLEVRDANMRELTVRLDAAVAAEQEASRRAEAALGRVTALEAVVAARDAEIARLREAEAELAAVKARAGYRLLEAVSARAGRIGPVRMLVRIAARVLNRPSG